MGRPHLPGATAATWGRYLLNPKTSPALSCAKALPIQTCNYKMSQQKSFGCMKHASSPQRMYILVLNQALEPHGVP
jgi:hypothetical protein